MVLRGARKTIESHHPILLIEVHEGGDLEPSQIPGLLIELGYEMKWLSHWKTPPMFWQAGKNTVRELAKQAPPRRIMSLNACERIGG